MSFSLLLGAHALANAAACCILRSESAHFSGRNVVHNAQFHAWKIVHLFAYVFPLPAKLS
jgi:hypothetical protein